MKNSTNPENSRKGLTPAQAQQVLRMQRFRCAACGDPLTGQWAADHDHAMAERHGHPPGRSCVREFRGMLCRPCNLALGYVSDEVGRLEALADYLKKWRAQQR